MTRIIIAAAIVLVLATPCAAGTVTTFHDKSGFVTGKSRTDSNGTTTFYDAAGRVVGKARTGRSR